MNILEKIIADKRLELKELKRITPWERLEKLAAAAKISASFYDALNTPGPSVIAEFKRKSPSKGILNEKANIESIIPAYINAGANAISVLTDIHFEGYSKDLADAHKISKVPLLRKDFIIDKYQILEAKALGASAILLIASALSKNEIEDFSTYAKSLGLDILLEIHHENELVKISEKNNIIGINNRNLSTFKVDLEHSIELVKKLPGDVLKISESGIEKPETALRLYENGFKAFLIGESFIKTDDPGAAAKNFIKALNV